MGKDDSTARKTRAKSLHDLIESLKTDKDGGQSSATPPVPESPAEFVHRRMRELDVKNKKKKQE